MVEGQNDAMFLQLRYASRSIVVAEKNSAIEVGSLPSLGPERRSRLLTALVQRKGGKHDSQIPDHDRVQEDASDGETALNACRRWLS